MTSFSCCARHGNSGRLLFDIWNCVNGGWFRGQQVIRNAALAQRNNKPSMEDLMQIGAMCCTLSCRHAGSPRCDTVGRWRNVLTAALGAAGLSATGMAFAVDPEVVDPNLKVRTVVSGLTQPTSMAFLAAGDLLVLEKPTGKVQRVRNDIIDSTVLDLAVNSASERGLL